MNDRALEVCPCALSKCMSYQSTLIFWVVFSSLHPFQNNDLAFMLYQWDVFVVISFFQYSFSGPGMYIDLFQEPGCPPVSHSFMTIEINFATVEGSHIGASSCPWTPLFILPAACAALQDSSGGSVLPAQEMPFICSSPLVVSANVLSVWHGSLLFSPDSVTFHWAPMAGALQ